MHLKIRNPCSLSLRDLSKAFDCISHTILLGKLEMYSIGGNVLHSLELYLVSIQQLVSNDGMGAASRKLKIEHGQGSVLELLLFIDLLKDLRHDDVGL